MRPQHASARVHTSGTGPRFGTDPRSCAAPPSWVGPRLGADPRSRASPGPGPVHATGDVSRSCAALCSRAGPRLGTGPRSCTGPHRDGSTPPTCIHTAGRVHAPCAAPRSWRVNAPGTSLPPLRPLHATGRPTLLRRFIFLGGSTPRHASRSLRRSTPGTDPRSCMGPRRCAAQRCCVAPPCWVG
jgi:hypothetical protein